MEKIIFSNLLGHNYGSSYYFKVTFPYNTSLEEADNMKKQLAQTPELIRTLRELSEAVMFLPSVDERTANANAKAIHLLNGIK